ncbi:hypothetical protein Rsub_10915 [Raphidocelis subcapitata]|uniref:AB hydrolase-1 domain-containing protein n=1 Tax=Raphidocelis subcapitata TaxID=307507 RepID=A0A2V0PD27_9CHLO|nr:hypothetical protein Rsub_10915 [Raphidocelis subcapitata]|eukprot:GBF97751.1 hypothetical protein Rsub_10915 [Raphidocelis subcapitata]
MTPFGAPPKTYAYPGAASIGQAVLDRCTILKQPFVPTPWAVNGHAQSALGVLRTLTAKGSYTRQLVMADDGGTLALDWWAGADRPGYAAPDTPVAFFIHGINGGSHEGYIKWACIAAAARGWRAVVLNLRGCNGLDVSSPRGYNALQTHDVHVALSSVSRRFPAAPLFAVGYSLGSVLLAKFVAEADSGLHGPSPAVEGAARAAAEGKAGSKAHGGGGGGSAWGRLSGSGLVAVALVSAPVCLHCTNARLAAPSPDLLYNLAVAYKLREYVREHLTSLAAHGVELDPGALAAVGWTVGAFDDAITLKQLGYSDGEDYYRHACTTNYLPHIRTPTLLLVAQDDPFLGYLPAAEVCANPFLALAVARRGGHLGFLSGAWPLGVSYADAAVDDWLASALDLAAEPGARGASWEARAAALGWEPPPGESHTVGALTGARCNCLERTRPDVVAARAAAAAAPSAGGGRGAPAAAEDLRRWRLEDVLRRPPPPGTQRSVARWLALLGRGGKDAGAGAVAADGEAARVAVPSVTLEVPSPTLDRRPNSRL